MSNHLKIMAKREIAKLDRSMRAAAQTQHVYAVMYDQLSKLEFVTDASKSAQRDELERLARLVREMNDTVQADAEQIQHWNDAVEGKI